MRVDYLKHDLLWHHYFKDCSHRLHLLQAFSPAERAVLENNPKSEPYQIHSVFITLLKICAQKQDLSRGSILHADVLRRGLLERSSYVVDALVRMYVKCGALAKAEELLVGLPVSDVFSWTQVIAGYSQKGQGHHALDCFERMQQEGVSPDAVTFNCILKGCGSIGAYEKGEQIHNEIQRQGLLRENTVLSTSLIDMYAKCGALGKAQQVFDALPARDAISWSALIAGYANNGQGEEALTCLDRMQDDGLSPDAVTFMCILKACGSIGAKRKGEEIHDEIARQGLLSKKMALGTALVDMYAKCGDLAKASKVLSELRVRDVVAWSALIAGYAQNGQGQEALDCFIRMQREGIFPNAVTYAAILKACGSIGALGKGEEIHHELARQGLLQKNVLLGTALVDMYAKCGALTKAQQVLENFPIGDVVSWCVLITGHAEKGHGEAVLQCFRSMLRKGLSPDAITFSCVLNACNQSGLVEEGQEFFDDMINKFGIKPKPEHYTSMVSLLARTGHVDKAVALIQSVKACDCTPALWSVLMESCRKSGDVKVGKWAFEQAMQVDKADVAPYFYMAHTCAAAGMEDETKSTKAMEQKKHSLYPSRLKLISV